jgi:FkbM family methyltransferase
MIKKLIQNLIPEKIKLLLKEKTGVPSQQSSLNRIKNLGFQPNYCLDIGAYEGMWTQEFKAIFPLCAILMVEGQLEKEPILIKTKTLYKDVDYQISLLGATESIVSFNKYETASSILDEHNITNAKIENRKLTLLDKLTEQAKFKPDFIKIDTQGYELEILKGGENTLASAEFVLLEVSFLDIYIDCPLVSDVLSYMDSKGFVVYDICTLMKRPFDKALFQSDFLFVKKNSIFRSNKRWS